MSGLPGQPTASATNYTAVNAEGKPLYTAMHTPIIYGKSYLGNNKFINAPENKAVSVSNTPVVTTPTITLPNVPSSIPDEVVDPKDIPLVTPGEIIETIPTIYTKPIDTDIPDDPVDPESIPLIIPEQPLELPDIPYVPETPDEKKDASYFDDVNAPDTVGPNRAGGGDLPEEFDKYLVTDFGGSTGGGGKYFDDMGSATMAYANGTTSVEGYARGTTGVDDDDPWNWTKTQQISAPLAAEIKPSNEQAAPPVKDQTEQYLSNQALAIGSNAASKGIEKGWAAYNAPLTTQAVGSMGTTATGAQVALPNMGAAIAPAESMYALSAPTMGGAGLGISTASAAPLGSSLGATLPAIASEGAGIAAAGSGAAATGAAMAGGEAALAAMGPIGWAVGAGLLAKKLKLF